MFSSYPYSGFFRSAHYFSVFFRGFRCRLVFKGLMLDPDFHQDDGKRRNTALGVVWHLPPMIPFRSDHYFSVFFRASRNKQAWQKGFDQLVLQIGIAGRH